MKKYLLRSVKYFIALCVLYVAMMALMHYSEHSVVTFAQRWELLFSTWRGWGMVVATILLAATYPYFGFTKRAFEGSITTDREEFAMAAEVSAWSWLQAVIRSCAIAPKGCAAWSSSTRMRLLSAKTALKLRSKGCVVLPCVLHSMPSDLSQTNIAERQAKYKKIRVFNSDEV